LTFLLFEAAWAVILALWRYTWKSGAISVAAITQITKQIVKRSARQFLQFLDAFSNMLGIIAGVLRQIAEDGVEYGVGLLGQ
jgi:hypothetical protein